MSNEFKVKRISHAVILDEDHFNYLNKTIIDLESKVSSQQSLISLLEEGMWLSVNQYCKKYNIGRTKAYKLMNSQQVEWMYKGKHRRILG